MAKSFPTIVRDRSTTMAD